MSDGGSHEERGRNLLGVDFSWSASILLATTLPHASYLIYDLENKVTGNLNPLKGSLISDPRWKEGSCLPRWPAEVPASQNGTSVSPDQPGATHLPPTTSIPQPDTEIPESPLFQDLEWNSQNQTILPGRCPACNRPLAASFPRPPHDLATVRITYYSSVCTAVGVLDGLPHVG